MRTKTYHVFFCLTPSCVRNCRKNRSGEVTRFLKGSFNVCLTQLRISFLNLSDEFTF
ncbi:hypothetical protein HanPSC8_Chr11g0475521 [Helianthus annuus]|nr:hypothetical protein HanPSC8_Chr11g0475521 [Helianthus annuus]